MIPQTTFPILLTHLLALLEHIWGSVLCQRLVIEMDGIFVLFFFEVGIANSSISSGKNKEAKVLAERGQSQRQGQS
jgi:hypothetical protein